MHLSPTELVIERLSRSNCRPVQRGHGWASRCPAHGDARPSLSIGTGDDGRALLTCHAGCSLESIVQAIGLQMVDLFPEDRPTYTLPDPPRLRDRERLGGQWVYRDTEGEPVAIVWRIDGERKRYSQAHRDGSQWHFTAHPSPRPLYALQSILRAPPEKIIIIVEGEKTADALAGCGYRVTTSMGGAQAAARTDWSPLRGRHVAIWPDADEPGRAYAAAVRAELGETPATIRVLDFGDRGGWDAADAIAEGADLEAILRGAVLVHERDASTLEIVDESNGEDDPLHLIDTVPGIDHASWAALPPQIVAWCSKLAVMLGVDPHLPLGVSLGVIASVVQIGWLGAIENSQTVWRENLGLFVAAVAGSGSRKSPVVGLCVEPIDEWKEQQGDRMRGKVADTERRRRDLTDELKRARKNGDDGHADIVQQQIDELEGHGTPPRIYVADGTSAALMDIAARQPCGSISVITPEPGKSIRLLLGAGKGEPDFHFPLAGYSGDSIDSVRKTVSSVAIRRPACSIVWACHRDSHRELMREKAARDEGFCQRFISLYCKPSAKPQLATDVDVARRMWGGTMRRLLEVATEYGQKGQRQKLSFAQSFHRINDWEHDVVKQYVARGRIPESAEEWCNKAGGRVIRMAAAMTLFDAACSSQASLVECKEIDPRWIDAAITLTEGTLIDHQCEVERRVGYVRPETEALYLDPVAAIIVGMAGTQARSFSPGELLEKVRGLLPKGREHMPNTRVMRYRIERALGTMRQHGVEIEMPEQGDQAKRTYTIRRSEA